MVMWHRAPNAQGIAVRRNWTTVAIATFALSMVSPRKADDITVEGRERMLRNL